MNMNYYNMIFLKMCNHSSFLLKETTLISQTIQYNDQKNSDKYPGLPLPTRNDSNFKGSNHFCVMNEVGELCISPKKLSNLIFKKSKYHEEVFLENLDGGSKISNSMPKQKEILFNLFLQLGKLGLQKVIDYVIQECQTRRLEIHREPQVFTWKSPFLLSDNSLTCQHICTT